MGGCLSVSVSCDQVVNQVSQWLCLKESYVRNLGENIESLEKAIGVLMAKRDDVQRRVSREEFTGERRVLSQVQVWLANLLEIENQVNDLLSTNKVELKKLCLCGFCSKNVQRTYHYGKSIITMLMEVENFGSQGEFDMVTEVTPVPEAIELPMQSIVVGQETLLERVWNHLMKDEIGIVGLYGMGGVGKTTLLKQINNKFTQKNGSFNVVIWIVVSSGATNYKIQGDIGEKLGLRGDDWDKKNENQRAIDIHNVLRRRKFVLLLDDIWEKVNLETIGVLYPTKENGCKVAFTTRSRDVCGRMGVYDPIKVSCLSSNKAWDLFQKKVGIKTLRSHPNIPELAKKVVNKCRGLPLALNVIGETMASKTTTQEWYHAIKVLNSSATEFAGMENDILPILKYSYDNLSGEQVKSCFLHCSLFPEDCPIEKERLIDYWIYEGFIDEKEDKEMALNQGYEILGTLVRASLLLDGMKNKTFVSMHDVVREMALWISSDLGKNKDQCIVQAGVGLREVPKVKNWSVLKKMSLMSNNIEKIVDSTECPQLTTLLLQRNQNLSIISGEFIRSMAKLLILDLSWNKNLVELPEEISELVSLRYLDLSYTDIKRLPLGLQELKMLIHLNLEWTTKLERLNGISNLSSLKTFKLQSSKMMLDLSLMNELEQLDNLEFISVNISSSIVGKQSLHDSKVRRCIQRLRITELPQKSVNILVLTVDMVNLNEIIIEDCGMQEIKLIEKTIRNESFANLSNVLILDCNGVKDLTWLLFAPNLTHLSIGFSKQVEAIIREEKTLSVLDEEEEMSKSIIPFRKLEYLELSCLPLLKSIFQSSLPFPCLREINIRMCPNLKKLPLNSESVGNVEELVINYNDEEWKESVEWEDEVTKLRFLDSFKI